MAEWEAPMTATWVGLSVGMAVVSFVGESAVSRWMELRWETVVGRGPSMGEEPVHRMRRLASIWMGEDDELDGETEMVHVD